MQCLLNYSGTRFFPVENKNYSVSQWILSYIFHITLYLCSEHSFVFFLNWLTVNERASISRAILEIEGNVVMYIHKYIHSYIQKSQMKLASGTGNPAWSCTQPELVPGFAALLNEAEYHWKNYGDSEMCNQPGPITPSEISNTVLLWYLLWLVFLSLWTGLLVNREPVHRLRFPYTLIHLICIYVSTIHVKYVCEIVLNCCMHSKCMVLYGNLTKVSYKP